MTHCNDSWHTKISLRQHKPVVSNQVKNDEPGDYEVTASLSMYVCRIVYVRMYGRHRLQLPQLVSSRLLSSSSFTCGIVLCNGRHRL